MNAFKIAAFLTKLNKREKLVFYGTVLAVGLALADRTVVGPILARMKSLDARIAAQQEAAKKNARIIAEKDRIKAALAAVNIYSQKAGTQEEEVANLLGEIEKMARKASLYVTDMKPLGVQEDKVSRRYTVDLNVEAQMDQVVTFMVEVENSSLLLFVDSFNIQPKSKDSSVAKVNMKISNAIFL